VIAFIVIPRVRALRTGARFTDQLLSGDFDHSQVGQHFASWFAENPTREIQRDRFVQFALGMGCPPPQVGERLLDCVMKVWSDPNARFGTLIGSHLDTLITFDPPQTPDQLDKQRLAQGQFEAFKQSLRQLDAQ
jgi:hypothetical protein